MISHLPPERLKYLRLLSERYPTVESLCTEISRIGALLSLPKGMEHFMSDIHGEYEAFCHIMNNCSGVVREKVKLWLGSRLTSEEADELCTLIYYPDQTLKKLHAAGEISPEWYRRRVEHLVHLTRMLTSKYTREKAREAMPESWSFLLDELLHYQSDEADVHSEQEGNRRRYHHAIVDAMIAIDSGDGVIRALASTIKHLAVDRLHVVGDIFDRGPRADSVMDILMKHHAVDIEWGNHDVLWMGAASGSEACICGVVRNCLSYGNMDILERGYGIPLRDLSLFAEHQYPDLSPFVAPKHAITVMMFKLEGQLIRRNPEFGMEDRLLLHRLDRENRCVEIDGTTWQIRALPFPTVSAEDPYALTPDEQEVLDGLRSAFMHSPRLHEHIAFLYQKGWMYRVYNGNLLYHGCIPMTEEGEFREKVLEGRTWKGRDFMNYTDRIARRAFYKGDRYALDFMWYLWCGTDSPVCGRRIKTFARAFVPDEAAWKEPQDPYYKWYRTEEKCRLILEEFGLTDAESRIINGHTPIHVGSGESPLRAGGRLVVIDGGFCRAYQKTTGIAGYTLIANSHGMRLMSHQPFTTLEDAQSTGRDIHSQSYEFATYPQRKYVSDTDYGKRLQERMQDLIDLLEASRKGLVILR
ncbi:MAG: fructose-1,6-bisphosphatase [Clostridia bacterium]|nr:fructose-1,6-bisphosphatase [Clostridia bacterium]